MKYIDCVQFTYTSEFTIIPVGPYAHRVINVMWRHNVEMVVIWLCDFRYYADKYSVNSREIMIIVILLQLSESFPPHATDRATRLYFICVMIVISMATVTAGIKLDALRDRSQVIFQHININARLCTFCTSLINELTLTPTSNSISLLIF